MNRQPRIGILIPQFPGQTHAFFWREIRALEARGVDVAIVSTRRPPPGIVAHLWSAEAMARTTYLGRPHPVDGALALSALPLRDLAGAGLEAWRDAALCLSAARAFVRTTREQAVSHVHVHSCGRSALIAALARKMGGPSYSLTLHGPLGDYGPLQGLKWRGARFACTITQGLLAEAEAELGANLPARVMVQPMGVDTDRFSRDVPFRPPGPDEALRIVSCGRLNQGKGHDDLLASMRIILDSGRAASLVILGEDDEGGTGYRQVLEARVTELGLGAHVRLPGAVDEGRVREELLAAHVFALASHAEPLGVALMEAMACGVPVIGTAAGGVGELISNGVDGILVPPRDPATLAGAILDLAGDPERAVRIAAAGRARVEAGFDAGIGAETLIREIGLT